MGWLIRIFGGQFFVDVDPVARRFADMQIAIVEMMKLIRDSP
jgi:Fe-S-cluster formation regulator IscX/YfhJ